MRSLWKERKARERILFIVCIGAMSLLGPAIAAGGVGPTSALWPVGFHVETPRVLRDDPHASATGEAAVALPTYRCRRTPRPIRVDERWDGAGWRPAASTGPFHNWDAQGVPEEPSEARLAYDARNLYVVFHCKDRDITSPYQNRDDPLWNEDVVELFISLPDDPLHYYEFEVSPANVLFDAKFFTPSGSGGRRTGGKAWNAEGIKTAVRVEGTLNRRGNADRSWTVQMRIPFTALGQRGAPAPDTVWRVNLYRIDAGSGAENRFAAWSPTLGRRPNFHQRERFGYLQFEP